jgi:anti-sigma regulatory factor (Ser/Thr protein kinase)
MNRIPFDAPVVLEVPSDPAALFLVRSVVEQLTKRLAFSSTEVRHLTQAVDEACSNVIRHAYNGRTDRRIRLTFLVKPDCLEVRLRDFGESADRLCFRPRDLRDIRPGGLGMHFIREAVDAMHYEKAPDGGGILRLIKFRGLSEGNT